jgi:hypothetical protein
MDLFIAGVIAMGFLTAGAFFLRFWRRTRDPLFMAFSAAFVLLAINQAIAALTTLGRDEIGWVWLLRLAAFCLIIAAIVWKNLGERR